MAWVCPKCGRKFNTERLYHSCEVISLEDHLKKCNPEIRILAENLMKKILKWKNVQITPLKSTILITAGSNFMSLKPRKAWVEMEFILKEETSEFPIYKTMKYSKNKFVHYVKFDSKKDINGQLMNWLKESHQNCLDKQ